MARPSRLYKYRRSDAHNGVWISQQMIHFSSPTQFNDPYDCALNVILGGTEQDQEKLLATSWLGKARNPEAFLRGFNEAIRTHLAGTGFASFGSGDLDLVMFAHYGANHTGYCLEYNANHPFFSRAFPVRYADYPVIDIKRIVERGSNYMSDCWDVLQQLVSHKAKQWQYEQEWRLKSHAGPPGPEPAHGTLRRVIVGTKASPATISEIQQLAAGINLPVYQAQLRPTDFGLDTGHLFGPVLPDP